MSILSKFFGYVASSLCTRISNVSDVFPPIDSKMSGERMEKDFWRACAIGDLATVRELARQRVDINCSDGYGMSGLMLAVRAGHYDLVVFFLSFPGIDVNVATDYGVTALHQAAVFNRVEIVRELLKRSDIRLDIKNRWGRNSER